MAISKINSKSIEDLQISADDLANGTVTGAKLSYPLTTFSSTGIDDNATSTAITIDSSENVTMSGDLTVDTNTLFVDASTDRVGINTTSPQKTFVVSNGGAEGFEISPTDVSATIRQIAYNRSTSSHLAFRYGALQHEFHVSDQEKMRITSAGRLGIGTTAPDATLEVNSGNGDTNSIFKSTDNNCLIIISDNDSSSTIAVESDGSGGVLKFNTGGNGSYANNSEAMRIDSSGNLKFNSGFGSVETAYGVRAWVSFNGTGTVAIRGSGNVSSITDSGEGQYYVNFTNNMPDTNFSTQVTTKYVPGSGVGVVAFLDNVNSTSRTHLIVTARMNSNYSVTDSDTVNVMVMR